MRNIGHYGVHPPALDESLQLVLKIFGLLSGESWHRKGTSITLARHAVASLAIIDLGPNLLARNGGLCGMHFCRTDHNHDDCCWHGQLRATEPHDPPSTAKNVGALIQCQDISPLRLQREAPVPVLQICTTPTNFRMLLTFASVTRSVHCFFKPIVTVRLFVPAFSKPFDYLLSLLL